MTGLTYLPVFSVLVRYMYVLISQVSSRYAFSTTIFFFFFILLGLQSRFVQQIVVKARILPKDPYSSVTEMANLVQPDVKFTSQVLPSSLL